MKQEKTLKKNLIMIKKNNNLNKHKKDILWKKMYK